MTDSPERISKSQDKAENKGLLSAESMSEFASSLSASVTGAVTFGVIAASKRTGLAIPAALLAGGMTKFGVKSGLEQAFVDEKDKTAGIHDIGWGAVDAVAGIVGMKADNLASSKFKQTIAREALGSNISKELGETAGKQLIADNVFTGVKHSLVRGIAGGSAGSFAWSVPHRVVENADALKENTAQGALSVSKQVLFDTAVGAALGGVISGTATSAFRGNEIFARAHNALKPQEELLQLRTLHLNDFHSQNDQLAAIKVVSDRLTADASKRGLPSQFVTVGDLEGCNVQYISTKAGMPENSALLKMGVTKFVPGNHTYDLGSGFNVPGYARTMSTLLGENPNASLIATNLDVSAFPEYQKIARRFTIDTIQGPKGPEKVATLGLVTKEGTALGDVPGIGYKDATKSAVDTMLDLAENQGVNKFVILSHLGLAEDQALAQALVKDPSLAAKNLKVASIFSAHTHDVTAAPVWVGKNGVSTGGLSTFRNTHGSYEIPIVQAGSNGRWLGQLDLAIRPDGAAERFATIGKMHPITPGMPRDAGLDAFVQSQTAELNALRNTNYNARIAGDITADNLRKGESQLGNILSDAIDAQVQADAVVTHSGWLRRGLETNVDPLTGKVLKPMTRETVADLFKSGGNAELEKGELQIFKMTGDEVRKILEFSVGRNDVPKAPTIRQMVHNAFSDKPLNPETEGHGYFSQVAGLKYDFDLSKAAGSRISNVSIRNGNNGFMPLDANREYSIASRQFIFDKWSKAGIFDGRTVGQTPVGKSPIEMVGEYLRNRDINSANFKPEGRIRDLTPAINELPYKISLSIMTPATLETADDAKYITSK
jgi:5'-nucleotidase